MSKGKHENTGAREHGSTGNAVPMAIQTFSVASWVFAKRLLVVGTLGESEGPEGECATRPFVGAGIGGRWVVVGLSRVHDEDEEQGMGSGRRGGQGTAEAGRVRVGGSRSGQEFVVGLGWLVGWGTWVGWQRVSEWERFGSVG